VKQLLREQAKERQSAEGSLAAAATATPTAAGEQYKRRRAGRETHSSFEKNTEKQQTD